MLRNILRQWLRKINSTEDKYNEYSKGNLLNRDNTLERNRNISLEGKEKLLLSTGKIDLDEENSDISKDEYKIKELSYDSNELKHTEGTITVNANLQNALKARYPGREYTTKEDMESLIDVVELYQADIKEIDKIGPLVGLEYATNIYKLIIIENQSNLGVLDLSSIPQILEVKLISSGVSGLIVAKDKCLLSVELDNNSYTYKSALTKICENNKAQFLDEQRLFSVNSSISFTKNEVLQKELNRILEVVLEEKREEYQSISKIELAQLIYVDLSGKKLTDIEPLKYLVSVKTLNLSNNNIGDIEPLSSLLNLSYLNLSNNNISVLPKDLSKLKSLKILDLSNDEIHSSNLNAAKEVDISINSIIDIKPITQITKLEQLYIQRNNVKELPNNLINLSNLKEINIDENYISDLRPIVDIPQINNNMIISGEILPNKEILITSSGSLNIDFRKLLIGFDRINSNTIIKLDNTIIYKGVDDIITIPNCKAGIYTLIYDVLIKDNRENIMTPLSVGQLNIRGNININAILSIPTRGVKLF